MSTLIERLGWVLVHTLWQFALLSAIAFVLQRTMQRASSSARYLVLLGMLAAIVAAPLVTWSVLPGKAPQPVIAAAPAPVPMPIPPALPREVMLAPTPVASPPAPLAEATVVPVVEAPPLPPAPLPELPQPTWSERVQGAVTPWLATIVWGWSLGVLVFALRPLMGWVTVRRLRTSGVSPVPEAVQAALAATAQRLGITQAVRVLQSAVVQVPIVAGYFKPVILLPVSIVTGMPTSQLEAILAHELAHIRRHDYLVNLVQILVETIFFYHPAVWWLSHQIRCERENCCDDIAVSALGSRLDYSRALLALEELRTSPSPLALGADGGSLLSRVRRLFRRDLAPERVSHGSLALGVLLVVSVLTFVAIAETGDVTVDEGSTPGSKIEIPGHGTLELVGLGESSTQWWSPEGVSMADALDPGMASDYFDFAPDRFHGHKLGVLARFRGRETLSQVGMTFKAPREAKWPHNGGSSQWWGQTERPQSPDHETEIHLVTTSIDPPATSGDCIVRLSFEPWRAWQTIDLVDPSQSENDGPLKLFVGKTPSSLASRQCEIGLQFQDGLHREIRFEQVALNAAGQEIQAGGGVGNRALGFRYYSVPESEVAKIKYRVQWYTHQVTFRHLALQAGRKTEPRVQMTPLATPPLETDQLVVAKLPGGLEIELVGITPNAAPTSEGWRGDGTPLGSIGHWPVGSTISKDGDQLSISTGDYSKSKTPHPLARDLLFEARGLWSHPSWVILNQKWTQFESVNADEAIRRRLSYLPKAAGEELTVEMAFSDSPWGPWQRIDPAGKRINTIETFAPDQKLYSEMQIVRLGSSANKTDQGSPLELVLIEPAVSDDYYSGVLSIELRFVDQDQKVWATYPRPEPMKDGRRTVTWTTGGPVPLESLAYAEFRLRPYRHFITFENVPLEKSAAGRVVVKQRSLPQPPASEPDPQFTAKVPGGIKVELLRIVRNDLPEDQSWKPDGTPASGLVDWPSRTHYKVQPDGNGYSSSSEGPGSARAWDVVYDVRNSGPHAFVSVDVVGEGSVSSSQTLPAIGPRLVTVLPKVPESLTAFQLRVGTELWGAWIQVGADGEILNPEAIRTATDAPDRLVKGIRAGLDAENLDRSWLQWRTPQNHSQHYQMEVRAIDDDGKVTESHSSTHSVSDRTHAEITRYFELPLDRLARFEYRLRPYRHLVTFENICTDPTKPTEVKVSVEPIVYPGEIASAPVAAKPILQMVESTGTHYIGGNVVQAHIGYTPPLHDAWMNWLEKDATASLEKLPAGKHWLIARHPWTVFPVELPLASSPLKQQPRAGLPPRKHSSNQYSGQLFVEVDETGKEFIRADVRNMTDEPWSFSELDLTLGAGWGGDESEAHSPLWLTEKLDETSRVEIAARQTGSFRIDWADWVRRGVWDPMSGVQEQDRPTLPEQQPGKVWVRIGGPGFGTLPVAVTHPVKIPEALSVTLPDGSVLELLGMTTPPIKVKLPDERTWWQANGTQLVDPVENLNNLRLGEDQADGRQALFRLTSRQSDASLHEISLETKGWSHSTTSLSPPSANEPSRLISIFVFGPIGDATTSTLEVRVATAPWTAWKFDLTGKPLDAPEVTDVLTKLRSAVEVLRAGPSEDGVAIWTHPFSSSSETGESRIIAIDKTGKEHFRNRSSGDGQEDLHGFGVSPKEFDHFELRVRPFGPKVKFENVSLQPGKKTEVNVVVESPLATADKQPPPLEFRLVAAAAVKTPVEFAGQKWFHIAGEAAPDSAGKPIVDKSSLGLPVERFSESHEHMGLLGDTPATSLPWDGTWHVEKCEVQPDPNGEDRFTINVTLDAPGGKALRTRTTGALRQRLAILVEERILVAPTVQEPIGTTFVITGNFTKEQAESLAKAIRRGMAPAAAVEGVGGQPDGGESTTPRIVE